MPKNKTRPEAFRPHDLVKRNVQVLLARRGATLKSVCLEKGVSYQLAHMWISHDMRLSSLWNLAVLLDVEPQFLVLDPDSSVSLTLTCPVASPPPQEPMNSNVS